MKNAYDVLVQKEVELAHLRREVESLRIVASLLADENSDDIQDNTQLETLDSSGSEALASAEEAAQQPKVNLDALANDRLFSSIGLSGSRLWKVFTRAS